MTIPWYKQKTTQVALGGIFAAISGYFTGEITATIMIGSIFTGLAVIFARQGIEKTGTAPIPWYKQKTVWTAISGVLAAIAGYLTGEIGVVGLVGAIFGGLAAIFGRQGIEKLSRYPKAKDRGVLLEQ
jgi:hypothetical protein